MLTEVHVLNGNSFLLDAFVTAPVIPWQCWKTRYAFYRHNYDVMCVICDIINMINMLRFKSA